MFKNRNRPSEQHRDHGSPYYGGKGILIDTAYTSNREVVLVVWLGLKRVDPTSVCWISKLEVPIAARDWADAYARGPVNPKEVFLSISLAAHRKIKRRYTTDNITWKI